MSLLVVHAPGLSLRHVQGGWLESLERHPPVGSARLVCAFPSTPAVVAKTIRSGVVPARHGCHCRQDAGRPDTPDVVHELTDRGVRWLALDELHRSLVEGGPRSPEEREALRRLDTLLATELARASGQQSRVLLVGGPPVRAAQGQVDVAAIEPVSRVDVDGGVAWISGEARLAPGIRDSWLSTRGVARLVAGRGLELLGCDPDRGSIAIAEPGWSFESGRGVSGGADAGREDGPVLLGWCDRSELVWPNDVHDVRVAATVAHAVGREFGEEDPLPL